MLNLEFVGPTGQVFFGTIERLSDNYFKDSSASPNFSNSYTFDQKSFLLVEGASENKGSYRPSVSFSSLSSWGDDKFFFRVHESGTNKTISASLFAMHAGYEVPIGFEGHLTNLYHSDILFNRDTVNATQEYTALFYNAGVIVSGNFNGVNISVVKRADGTELLSGAMTKITGPYAIYKYDTAVQASFVQLGEAAIVLISAGASGSLPSLTQACIVGRDS